MARALTLYDHDPNASAPLWLVQEKGKLVSVSSNQSLALDNPASIWVVFSGRVDLFAVQIDQGRDTGQRRWLFRAETGQVLFGFDTKIQCPNLRIIASSTPGTTLLELPRARLQSLATMPQSGPDVIRFLEEWVKALSNASTSQLLPRNYETLAIGQENAFPQETAVLPPAATVWVRHRTGSSSLTNTQPLPQATQNAFLPVCRPMWLQIESKSTLEVISTRDLVVQDATWKSLDYYHGLVLDRLYKLAIQTQKTQEARLEAKAQAEQELLSGALDQLAAVLDKDRMPAPLAERATHDPFVIACQWVCQAIGIPAETIAQAPQTQQRSSVTLDRVTQAMRVQKRRVVLHGEWWQQDSGPLLAFVGEQAFEHPVALLPRSPHEYELCDPVSQTRTRVTRQVAETLYPFAYAFYRPFPARALGAWDLVQFGLQGNRNDLRTFLLAGAAGGALALLVPLATGWLFNELIPDNEFSQIAQVFAALLVSAIASTAFHFTRSIALVRIQARVSASLQSAIWDRLLNLPTSFFREFSAGDLASRAMGIETIRRTLTTTTLSAIFAGVFAILNVGMMFYYSPRLAWISALLVLVVTATAAVFGYAQIGHQRHLTRIRGQLYGLILQLVTGITKLRVAGAEGRAFAFWSKRFRAQKDRDYRAQQTVNVLSTLNAVYPTLNAMVLFALAAATSQESDALSPGDFVAFYAAFGQLLSAGLQTSASLLSISNIVPIYERAKPILETLPEVDDLKADPGELLGEMDVDHVDFSYSSAGPQILHDLSLHIDPGEFVALVGPSGSGKSTLFRLLLGFEAPQAGTILYDGQELAKLNIRAVRRQIGVVLQTGKLVRGTVLENIVGSAPLTVEDAWQAARLVGLDRDIEQMPMGMYTVISTGGSTLSGGQRQRILIARAIVHRPRILLFDEATSALDNITQATVSQSLAHIQATRIVIAHRLSTIRQADRIVVLEHGRIVQVGSYAELSSQQGLFTDLAKRQTL